MPPYQQILKQAWLITKTNKFLWLFGLFLIWGNALNVALSWQDQNASKENINISPWLFLFGLIILVMLIILYFRAKAGLIIAIKAILDKQDTSFNRAWRASILFYSRLINVAIISQLAMFGSILLIVGPIAYLIMQHYEVRAFILSVLGLAALVPILFLITFVNVLAPLFIVLFDLKPMEAAAKSFDLISRHWKKLIAYGCLIVLIQIAIFALSLPFVLFPILSYHKVGLALSFPLSLLVIILGSIVFLTAQSVVTAFMQTVWVLVFQHLIRPEKLEDEETVPVPETIG